MVRWDQILTKSVTFNFALMLLRKVMLQVLFSPTKGKITTITGLSRRKITLCIQYRGKGNGKNTLSSPRTAPCFWCLVTQFNLLHAAWSLEKWFPLPRKMQWRAIAQFHTWWFHRSWFVRIVFLDNWTSN